MRWKVQRRVKGTLLVWSLGYPTKRAAQAAARRLNQTSDARFSVGKMTPEDEALASELERHQ